MTPVGTFDGLQAWRAADLFGGLDAVLPREKEQSACLVRALDVDE
jgi:hypothetical protein